MIRSYKIGDKKDVKLVNRLCHPGFIKLSSKCIIRVIEHGFYAFTTNVEDFEIIRFCVHPDWRGMGIGTLLHLDLLKLAMQHSKKKLVSIVHEESDGLNWLRDCWGWEAKGIKKDYFGDRDGYIMERQIIR